MYYNENNISIFESEIFPSGTSFVFARSRHSIAFD